jgi:succinate-acetate transporter protein
MTATPRYGPAGPAGDGRTLENLAVAEDHQGWVSRSRVVLTPIVAPSILGLFGFFIATLMVGAWLAGWFGPAAATATLWPFALFTGGAMQTIAAIASFRARDGVALTFHGVWGAFWLGWSLLAALAAAGVMAAIAIGASSPAFAFWFIGLTCVTGLCMIAAAGRNLLLSLTLAFLTLASVLAAAGFYGGAAVVVNAGGWLFVCSAVAAFVTAGAMLLEHEYNRTIIPLGKWSKQANIPGARTATDPIEYPAGMPGLSVHSRS